MLIGNVAAGAGLRRDPDLVTANVVRGLTPPHEKTCGCSEAGPV